MKPFFLLDSGDPDEFKELAEIFKKNKAELWGATTNPTLIAKKVNKKVTQDEALELQKQIVLEIIDIVPGAVSAEVYADKNTGAKEMIEQGRQIAAWNQHVVVKLPTTIEGFRARTTLRKEGIPVNNTLVFSQQQIFAICLHEQIIQEAYQPKETPYPPFISPFVGRLDDTGEDGMSLVEHGMRIKDLFKKVTCWMLEASVRSADHIERGQNIGTELLTAPVKIYKEWFGLTPKSAYSKSLKPIDIWSPPQELLAITTIEAFIEALESKKLDINHELTDSGLAKFAKDWRSILEV